MFKTTLVVAFLAVVLVHDAQSTKRYSITPKKQSFIGAWIGCKTAGMKMASVQSDTEQAALEDVIDKSSDSTDTGYWIGGATPELNDIGWYWLDAEVKVTFTYWGTTQPRYDEDNNESGYCIRVGNFYQIKEPYKWENIHCDSELYYICEYED